MAQIEINEVSANLSYAIGNNSYCCVALPITSCWGPGFFDPETLGKDRQTVLEDTVWQRFPATQDGIEAFSSTYRGAASNYRMSKDYSYQMALTLLSAGYDVLTCRLCPGSVAQSKEYVDTVNGGTFTIKAKYPGSFGNHLLCSLQKVINRNYWNLITYTVDDSGVKSPVENFVFVFEAENSTDSILQLNEVESSFVNIVTTGTLKEDSKFEGIENGIYLGATDDTKGSDRAVDDTAENMLDDAITLAKMRFAVYNTDDPDTLPYIQALNTLKSSRPDVSKASAVKYMEWMYYNCLDVYDLLKDRLAYNPQRVISPGWDDQNITEIDGEEVKHMEYLSPMHIKLMEVSYFARCATAGIDLPKCLQRSGVYNTSANAALEGYAQKLARYLPNNAALDINGSLWSTHYAIFGPWGTYRYVATRKMNIAPPSFLALMIKRSLVKQQTLQYEWIQPSTRKSTVNIGKMDYTVPKRVLDQWQPDPDSTGGVGVNAIANIPDLGMSCWGDSTAYEVPPATYQALRNLSIRLLVNAIKDVIYRVGIAITFRYNNQDAYSAFYAGVDPILSTMRNVGALEDYYMTMGAGVDANGSVKANTAVGKVYIVPYGTIQKIAVDLIALPVGTDLSVYAESN